MNLSLSLRILTPIRISFNVLNKSYSKKDTGAVSMVGGVLKKKKMGKLGPMMEKKILDVETDPNKLVNYVCGSNIYKTGEDLVIKPDSEYPDWLWTLRTGNPLKLEDMEPGSKEYYLKVRKLGMQRNNKMKQLRRF